MWYLELLDANPPLAVFGVPAAIFLLVTGIPRLWKRWKEREKSKRQKHESALHPLLWNPGPIEDLRREERKGLLTSEQEVLIAVDHYEKRTSKEETFSKHRREYYRQKLAVNLTTEERE